jgi:hypothetical protein
VSAARRLVSLRRRTEAASRERYGALWTGLASAAIASGAHAWRFVARDDPDLRLEFLEFADGSDPRDLPEVTSFLLRLDSEIGDAEVEEWNEG